jgi:hypothetical protein
VSFCNLDWRFWPHSLWLCELVTPQALTCTRAFTLQHFYQACPDRMFDICTPRTATRVQSHTLTLPHFTFALSHLRPHTHTHDNSPSELHPVKVLLGASQPSTAHTPRLSRPPFVNRQYDEFASRGDANAPRRDRPHEVPTSSSLPCSAPHPRRAKSPCPRA